MDEEEIILKKMLFLEHEELVYVRRLSKEGRLNEAEELLYKSQPTPAVLDEIRKISSKKAKISKDNKDWLSVLKHLEKYSNYANKWHNFCVKFVNQAPPEHTSRDKKLLKEAKEKIRLLNDNKKDN